MTPGGEIRPRAAIGSNALLGAISTRVDAPHRAHPALRAGQLAVEIDADLEARVAGDDLDCCRAADRVADDPDVLQVEVAYERRVRLELREATTRPSSAYSASQRTAAASAPTRTFPPARQSSLAFHMEGESRIRSRRCRTCPQLAFRDVRERGLHARQLLRVAAIHPRLDRIELRPEIRHTLGPCIRRTPRPLSLTAVRSERSLTPSSSPRASCGSAAFTFPAVGVGRRGRLQIVVAPLRRLRPRGVRYTGRATDRRSSGAVCRTAVDVVPVRLVRRERVEVVSPAVGEEPAEESQPVEAFVAETPEARRRRLMPDRRVAAIEQAVLS